MFTAPHSDVNFKSGFLHLTGQPNSEKVKDGIISETEFLRTFSVDQYNQISSVLHYKHILM